MVPEEDVQWDKIVGQFRLSLYTIMKPLRMYGQHHYCDSAIKEIESLAIQLHRRLSGVDEPFHINHDCLHW